MSEVDVNINSDTRVSSTLSRTIAAAVALTVAAVTAGIGYAHLEGRISGLGDALKTHRDDASVHLDHEYHIAHGRPVGNFDFTVSLEQLKHSVEDLQKRPVVISGNCKMVRAGILCDQKE